MPNREIIALGNKVAAWAETFPPELSAQIVALTGKVDTYADAEEGRRVVAALRMFLDVYNLAAGVGNFRRAK